MSLVDREPQTRRYGLPGVALRYTSANYGKAHWGAFAGSRGLYTFAAHPPTHCRCELAGSRLDTPDLVIRLR